MDVREGEDVEFKREMSPGAVKTVIAFVSTGGGTLCIGVDDEGVPVGVDDVDAEMTRVTSCLRDSVKPDILMMISIVSEVIDGHDVIAVHVGRGVRRPYYLASRALARRAFCHMGRVDALAAVRGLTADGGDGRVWSLASRWGLA